MMETFLSSLSLEKELHSRSSFHSSNPADGQTYQRIGHGCPFITLIEESRHLPSGSSIPLDKLSNLNHILSLPLQAGIAFAKRIQLVHITILENQSAFLSTVNLLRSTPTGNRQILLLIFSQVKLDNHFIMIREPMFNLIYKPLQIKAFKCLNQSIPKPHSSGNLDDQSRSDPPSYIASDSAG